MDKAGWKYKEKDRLQRDQCQIQKYDKKNTKQHPTACKYESEPATSSKDNAELLQRRQEIQEADPIRDRSTTKIRRQCTTPTSRKNSNKNIESGSRRAKQKIYKRRNRNGWDGQTTSGHYGGARKNIPTQQGGDDSVGTRMDIQTRGMGGAEKNRRRRIPHKKGESLKQESARRGKQMRRHQRRQQKLPVVPTWGAASKYIKQTEEKYNMQHTTSST